MVRSLQGQRLVRVAHAQPRAPDLEQAIRHGQLPRALVPPPGDANAVHAAEVRSEYGPVRCHLDRGMQRGSIRVIEDHIRPRAAPDGDMAFLRGKRHAVAGLDAAVAPQRFDDDELGRHGFHSIAST